MSFIWKHRKASAIFAALLALGGGLALAAWITLSTLTITPNTYNTGSVQAAGLQVNAGSDCVTPVTANIWPAVTAALPGTISSGSVCLVNTATVTEYVGLSSVNQNIVLGAATKVRVTSAGTASTAALAAALPCTLPNMLADGTATGAQPEWYFGPLYGWQSGDTAQGLQAGDRTLNTTTAKVEKLCVSVVLPTGASETLAGQSNFANVTISASP